MEPGSAARALIVQKAPGMVFGLDVAEAVFRRLDPQVRLERRRREGEWLAEPRPRSWRWRAMPAPS